MEELLGEGQEDSGKAGTHYAVMSWRVMFGEVIGKNVGATMPVDKELAFGNVTID